MSDQPPLVPPSAGGPTEPVYPSYEAPAWGEGSPEPSYAVTPRPVASYGIPQQYRGGYGTPTHPLATTSLVLGIIGLVSLVLTPFLIVTIVGGICSPFAVWFGIWGRRRVRADPQRYAGDGVALAGLVTGIVGVVLLVLAIIGIVLLAALLSAALSDY